MPNSADPFFAPLTEASRQHLSTAHVAVNDRFSYWLDMICAVYARLECDRPSTEGIVGDIEFSRLGTLDLTRLRSNVRHVRRTPSMIRSDTRDSCLVHIQREGRAWVAQDGRQAHLSPGDFTMYDTTRPYELHFEDPQHDVVVVRLPRQQIDPHVADWHDLTATTVSGTGAAGHLLITMIDSLSLTIDQLNPSSAISVSEGITSIISAGLRSLPNANQRKGSNLSHYHIARVKAFVMDHLRDPELSISRIAAAMKMSPDHLSRLFRTEPVPLSRLIWQLRLDACRRDLGDLRLMQRSISDVAYAWGFNDATHFSRSFKEQFGTTPREWRQQVQGQEVV